MVGHIVSEPAMSFSGKCPSCGGYVSRIRTEVINYASDTPVNEVVPAKIVSRTRIFACNTCQHVWSETARK